jgi:hypothetical protein
MNNETEYEWLPEPSDLGWGWTTDPSVIAGRKCRQPRCGRPAVAGFYRPAHRGHLTYRFFWACCDNPEHLYGRRIVDGRVEQKAMVGSPFWQRAKAEAGR